MRFYHQRLSVMRATLLFFGVLTCSHVHLNFELLKD